MRSVRSGWALMMLALLAGCAGSRGVVFSDGQVEADTPERWRDQQAAVLAARLQPQLGDAWRASVSIGELPERHRARRAHEEAWQWEEAHAQVLLVARAADAPQPDTDAVAETAYRFLRTRVANARHVHVEVAQTVDAERFAVLAAPSAAAAPAGGQGAAAPAPAGSAVGAGSGHATVHDRRYVVVAGDTLADISAAFYGTASGWRRILQANPEVDVQDLRPGTVLVIPPLDASAVAAPAPTADAPASTGGAATRDQPAPAPATEPQAPTAR